MRFDHCHTEPVAAALLSEKAWIAATALSEKEVVANRGVADGERPGENDAHEFLSGKPGNLAIERYDSREAASIVRKQVELG